jgi:hypothetical protein
VAVMGWRRGACGSNGLEERSMWQVWVREEVHVAGMSYRRGACGRYGLEERCTLVSGA